MLAWCLAERQQHYLAKLSPGNQLYPDESPKLTSWSRLQPYPQCKFDYTHHTGLLESALVGWCAEFTEFSPHRTGEKGGRSHLPVSFPKGLTAGGFHLHAAYIAFWGLSSRTQGLNIFFFFFRKPPQIKMATGAMQELHRANRAAGASRALGSASSRGSSVHRSPARGWGGPPGVSAPRSVRYRPGLARRPLSSSSSVTEPRAGPAPPEPPRPPGGAGPGSGRRARPGRHHLPPSARPVRHRLLLLLLSSSSAA